jgi:hypothetical protein
MQEAEGINFKVGAMSKNTGGAEERRLSTSRGPKYDNPTLADIMKFIASLSVSEESKKKLISVARKMPNGSLANFRSNYSVYLKNK